MIQRIQAWARSLGCKMGHHRFKIISREPLAGGFFYLSWFRCECCGCRRRNLLVL